MRVTPEGVPAEGTEVRALGQSAHSLPSALTFGKPPTRRFPILSVRIIGAVVPRGWLSREACGP